MNDPFPRLSAAAVDGRAHNIRYRQKQLHRLHAKLFAEENALKQAVMADTGCLKFEADLEFTSSVLELKQHYDNLNSKTALESSNSIQSGKDNLERRVPSGIVYIVPTAHTLLYSVVAPLTTAMAAGNCVVVELPDTIRRLGSVLKKSLVEALDPDTFAVSSSRSSPQYMNNVLCVFQEEEMRSNRMTARQSLISPPGQSVAVITRNADIEDAALTLTSACLMFNGTSPHSPDIIFVDEFAAEQLISAIAQHMSTFSTLRNQENIATQKILKSSTMSGAKVLEEPSVKLVASGASGAIVEILDRGSSLLRNKSGTPLLKILRMSSMDDAIDFLNGGECLCALTVFAELVEANYLCNFVDARAAYVNHFPFELLLGPISPLGYPTQLSPRYSTLMFSDPQPRLIMKTIMTKVLEKVIGISQASGSRELSELADVVLEPKKQPDGGTLDFFLQGLMTGAVAAMVSGLVLATATARYAVPYLRTNMLHGMQG